VTERITSRQNVRVKEAAKLRGSRQRVKQGRILIDGVREVGRALDAGVRVVELFVCETQEVELPLLLLVERLIEVKIATVTPEVFEKLSFGERAAGVVAVAELPIRLLTELQLPPRPLVAVLAGLEKPGNLGAILRTADGAGVDAVIVADGGTDLYNPNTIRASMGAVFRANVCAASAKEVLAQLREWQVSLVATRVDAPMCYTEFDYTHGAAILLGSEADGLGPEWRADDVTAVHVPMRGMADSLNVSVAAGILFYEALRQKMTNDQ
jgi:TrmH family RNA methyltransferase